MHKLEIVTMIDTNQMREEKQCAALINNLFTVRRIVNDNIDANAFSTWLKKMLFLELPKNRVIIMDYTAFYKSYRTKNVYELEFLPPWFKAYCINNSKHELYKQKDNTLLSRFLTNIYHNIIITIQLYCIYPPVNKIKLNIFTLFLHKHTNNYI